jgi:hypothetical protein
LDSLVNEDGESRKWFKVNEPGYSVYPLIGEVKDGIINSSNFNKQGGFYKINLLSKTGDCETKGYLDLDVIPMPIPLIVKTELKDSVKFTDKSLYQTSRFWYLDTLFVSNGVNITLYKKVATGKSIMLRLSNFKCSMDTVFSYKMLEMSSFKNDLISIYPNPVTQNLTIEIGERKPYQLKVLNVLGQIVLQKVIYLPEETLDVANFSNGVYTLEISDKDITSRLKFIKE